MPAEQPKVTDSGDSSTTSLPRWGGFEKMSYQVRWLVAGDPADRQRDQTGGSQLATISAYQTAHGKRYRVRYRKPDHAQTDKRGFKTKREAELFAASVEVAKSRGEFIDATAARATVGTLGAEWIATQSHLKPSTARSVDSAWRIHVIPAWGIRAVGDIRHSEVQAWVTLLAATRSATTVKRAHGILSSILDRAEKDRRIAANPARGVNLPRRSGRKHVYLTHAQVTMLAEQSGEHGTLVSTTREY